MALKVRRPVYLEIPRDMVSADIVVPTVFEHVELKVDNGRIAAVGVHAELLKSCAVYQRLHEAQFQRMVA